MKKLFGFVVAVVAMLAMASCGGGGNSPKSVAEQFIKAVQKQDGKKYSSHWWTSPLKDPELTACRTCHSDKTPEFLRARVHDIQEKTMGILRLSTFFGNRKY